jgi:hypothetical protein
MNVPFFALILPSIVALPSTSIAKTFFRYRLPFSSIYPFPNSNNESSLSSLAYPKAILLST